uniref:Uncharacterized protein n=1 Tax=candidate division CPR3 bacterium TaxID=2268181 RepID=A0A7C4M569_UNCC3
MRTRFHINTGEQDLVQKQIDDFFQEIIQTIGINNDHPPEFDMQCLNFPRTDDVIQILFCKEKPVAIVTYTRNQSNFIDITFFKNTDEIKTNPEGITE